MKGGVGLLFLIILVLWPHLVVPRANSWLCLNESLVRLRVPLIKPRLVSNMLHCVSGLWIPGSEDEDWRTVTR